MMNSELVACLKLAGN